MGYQKMKIFAILSLVLLSSYANAENEEALEDFVHCDTLEMNEMHSACGEFDPTKRCRMFFRAPEGLRRKMILEMNEDGMPEAKVVYLADGLSEDDCDAFTPAMAKVECKCRDWGY